MAQTLFEAINGIPLDSQTVLTVQTLLDAQNNSTIGISENGEVVNDEEDVFQCGRCKKQFSTLQDFILHKKTHTPGHSGSNSESCQNFQTDNDIGNPIILNESDILSFSIDQAGLNIDSNSQVLPSLEENEAFSSANDGLKNMQMVECDSNSFHIEPVQAGQIILTAQVPDESTGNHLAKNTTLAEILTGTEGKTHTELQYTAQEEIGYFNSNGIINVVDKTLDDGPNCADTVTLSVLKMVQDPITITEQREGRDHNIVGKLKCLHCGKLFMKNFDLQQHVRSHTGERPYQCIVCGRTFAQKSNVKKHMSTHKVWPKRLRTLCYESAQPPKGDEENGGGAAELSDASQTYSCQYCPSVFGTFFQLKSHRKQHTQQKVYKCIQKECDETFQELDTFLQHLNVHANEAQYRCHICNKEFASLDELGVHQYNHKSQPKQQTKAATCKLCKSRFVNPEALERHMATYSHRYMCPKCSKLFTCERFLRRHLSTHNTVATHVCQHCGKAFKTEQYLKNHKIIHSSEKPFQCKMCSAAFNRRDKLVRHSLIHETARKFKCPFNKHLGCNREFNRKDKLKQHILTHSSANRILCKICGVVFNENSFFHSQLKEHAKVCNAQSYKDCSNGLPADEGSSLAKKSVPVKVPLSKSNNDQKSSSITRRKKRTATEIKEEKNVDATRETDAEGVRTIEIIVVPVSSEAALPLDSKALVSHSITNGSASANNDNTTTKQDSISNNNNNMFT